MLESELEYLLKPVIHKEGILNAKIRISGGNEKGDGYLGIVTAVEMQGSNRTLNLIVKTAPKSEELRKQTPIKQAFLTEINFYTTVYPAFRQFQVENGDVRPFVTIARCYGTSKRELMEALVFENLKSSGYVLYNRQKTMDMEHVAIVLEEYGRLHALSYALKDSNSEKLDQLAGGTEDCLKQFIDSPSFEKMFSGLVEKIKGIAQIRDDAKLLAAVENFYNNNLDFLKSLNSSNADKYAVLTHGDCWCNNMMFKYEDPNHPNVPTGMCLIDWQLQRIGSPVLDLSYFLYACAGKEIFNKLEKCLSIYHNSLGAQLKKLGCNVDKLLPYDVLKEQWKMYSKFGLTMSLVVIRIMLSDSDEAPDLVNAAETGKSVIESFDFQSKYEEQYRRRVLDVVLHFYNNKFM